MQILDGAAVSKHILEQIKADTAALVATGARAPHLAAVLVGEDPASQVYVGSKVRTCDRTGPAGSMPADRSGIQFRPAASQDTRN